MRGSWTKVLALSGLMGCTTEVVVLESTTTTIPESGGQALSADGLFSVNFPAGAVAGETVVEIATASAPPPAGALSRIYEVQIQEQALKGEARLTLSFAGSTLSTTVPLAVGELQADQQLRVLTGTFDEVRREVRAEVLAFRSGRFYALQAPIGPPDPSPEGWDDPVGSGPLYVINQLSIAGPNVGFDVDQACTVDGCIDNRLWRLGTYFNDHLRQALLGGAFLAGLELAGLNNPYRGDDPSLTLKFYGLRDFDDPFYPANDFRVPPGGTTCCEFEVDPASLASGGQQARQRSPAAINRGLLSTLAPTELSLNLPLGPAPHRSMLIHGSLTESHIHTSTTVVLGALTQGLLGGAVDLNTLADLPNQGCLTVSSSCAVAFTQDHSLLDLVSTLLGPAPDIDRDGDGFECVLDTDGDARIDLCCDGAPEGSCTVGSSTCVGSAVAPLVPGRPESCALQPQMADGYSIGLSFTAVPASLR